MLFDLPLSTERIRRLVGRVTEVVANTVVRVTVYDPELSMGAPVNGRPGILVSTRDPRTPTGVQPMLGALRLSSSAYDRELPTIKHVSLFGSIRQRRLAQASGFDDALFTGTDGRISEGPTWNIGFYDGERVIWPKANILEGVTMRLIDQLLPSIGVVSESIEFRLSDIHSMACAFATNAAFGVRPVASIDGNELDSAHPIIGQIMTAYLGVPTTPI